MPELPAGTESMKTYSDAWAEALDTSPPIAKRRSKAAKAGRLVVDARLLPGVWTHCNKTPRGNVADQAPVRPCLARILVRDMTDPAEYPARLSELLLEPDQAASMRAPAGVKAAVLVPLYPDDGRLVAVFTKRTEEM